MSGRVTARPGTGAEDVRVEAVRYDVVGWGAGELWMRGAVVLAHEFHYVLRDLPRARPPEGAASPPDGTVGVIPSEVGNGPVPRSRQSLSDLPPESSAGLVELFRHFLAGNPVGFDDVELDLEWATPFQRALTSALRTIPRGEVVTYGELAALAGRPGAARATGTFCATNRFALVVPCHRVVASNGIGGYGPDGVAVKRRLLALEGVLL